jgi:hypothetical protein
VTQQGSRFRLGEINAYVWSGPFFAFGGAITFRAAETWGPVSRGTAIEFSTVQNGQILRNQRMVIDHNGFVGIGTQTPPTSWTSTATSRRHQRNERLSDEQQRRLPCRSVLIGSAAEAGRRPVLEQTYGLFAQDVAEVLPELVSTDAGGYQAVDYSKLPLLAMQAIKELKEKNDALEGRLAEIEARLTSQNARPGGGFPRRSAHREAGPVFKEVRG